MGLFTPFYMKGNLTRKQLESAVSKVRGTGNTKKLARIALEAPESRLRMIAVEKLGHDAALILEVALKDDQSSIRKLAVQSLAQLGDEPALAKIAMNASEDNGRIETAAQAAEAVRNQALLVEIARKAPLVMPRRKAVERLNDAEALANVAVSDPNGYVRQDAVERVADQQVLCRIALEDDSWPVRRSAAKRISDPQLLCRIALEDKAADVRRVAVENEHLTDPDTLARIALGDSDDKVCAAVTCKIDDPDLLGKIALTGYPSARLVAIERIDDVSILTGIADEETKDHTPNWAAALRLSQVAPSLAVEPLVQLMILDRHAHWHPGFPVRDFRERTVAFLTDRYKSTTDPAVREQIAALPNGWYGWADPDACMHYDETIHFDLAR